MRLVVAQVLCNVCDGSPDTIAAIVALSQDDVDEIRSWATYALAAESLAGVPQVREALLARLDDPSKDVRTEAERGLDRS